MPELPEVETVRRGLAPVMEGARFAKVEVHRGDLRWPLPKDFAQRLRGRTVTSVGRRAKYLLVDLSSGDALIMHLGMSGSFHVFRGGGGKALGRVVAGDAESYRYLVESIRRFPKPQPFADMLRTAGFARVSYRLMTGGIVALHSGWRL